MRPEDEQHPPSDQPPSNQPWTVSGIDRGSQEIARSAAQQAGMEVDAWVDRAILGAARTLRSAADATALAAPFSPPRPLARGNRRPRSLRPVAASAILMAILAAGVTVFLWLAREPDLAQQQSLAEQAERSLPETPPPVDRPPATIQTAPRTPVEEAARQGDSRAQYDLGVRYAQGDGEAPDYKRAAHWFTEAALQGMADAQYNLGVLFERGFGVAPNAREAAVWYQSAAEQGHSAAQYNLALAYARGNGLPTNPVRAARWFSAAAEQGLPEAQYNMGLLLEKGDGVARDGEKAKIWYQRAAKLGNEAARARLGALGLPVPSTAQPKPLVTAALSSAQIAEAQRLLAALDFDPGHADGVVGAKTRDAVRLYQQVFGLTETGELTEELLIDLRAVAGVTAR